MDIQFGIKPPTGGFFHALKRAHPRRGKPNLHALGRGKGQLMPEESNEEKTFTQSQLDEVLKERLARERGKYADYEELAEKAKAYDDAKEADATELQKATTRAEKAEAELKAYAEKEKHAALVKKVMDENKVDAKYASLLTASDEDGLVEQAKLLTEKFADSVPSDTGKQVNVSAENSANAKFAHELFGGK